MNKINFPTGSTRPSDKAAEVRQKIELEANARLKILKPIHEVFEGIVDPNKMSHYFITHGSSRMEEGQAVTWTWADHGDAKLIVQVQKIEKDKYISFSWSASGVHTITEIRLTSIDSNITLVVINETGWDKDDRGISRLVEQTHGWAHFLCGLKAFLEHGINIRIGAF